MLNVTYESDKTALKLSEFYLNSNLKKLNSDF